MLTNMDRADVLIEALPYIKEFYGKTIVLKYGGNAMINEDIKEQVIKDIVLMKYVGINPVVVHGGGPEINKMLEKIGKKSEFNCGNRVTDAETMEIVEMVLAGKLNQEIVSKLNKYGGKAVGLTGKDANSILAEKKYIESNGESIDIGFVGKVKKINPKMIKILQNEGYIPVISSIGVDEDGNTYNINADYVAGEVAAALSADKFILMTDIKGIMKDLNDPTSLVNSISLKEINDMIADGIISGGMLPKVDACITAINKGANRVHIIDGRINHALILELFTDEGVGTMITK
ncbi:MAG: acetylglutamate kinase [Fusobacteria bacterium]|nr:acetylglutamate kinase [Fusobacteriota bacterium]